MSEVRVKDGESLENALKRFKRNCAKSGVLAEVRKREHYESPSVKRRKKSEAARNFPLPGSQVPVADISGACYNGLCRRWSDCLEIL